MKSQAQHIGNYSNVFDYSPFGVELDGRTIENIFYQEEFTTDTITETAYALEETFATSSNWSTTTSHSQISYPLSKMRVKNNASTKKTIGTRKSFTTGSGLHQLRFTISYLPNTLCEVMGGPILMGNEANATNAVNNKLYLNVLVKDQNNNVVISDSINTLGDFSHLSFLSTAGNTYTLEFYLHKACFAIAVNNYFEVDNVFVSYVEEVVVENKNYVVSGGWRYGMQGWERDDEIKGLGNHISWGDYGYDPRIVRRWQPDPLQAKYPWQSPYSVLGNNPILHKEIDGRDYEVVVDKSENGNTITIKATYYTDVKDSDSYNSAKKATEFWNNHSSKYQYTVLENDGSKTSYDVVFDFKVSPVTQKEIDNSPLKNAVATVESRANADKSGNSYIVLPDDDDRLDESFGASTLGFLIYVSDSRKNTDTGSHEIGHTLNLGHFNFGIMQEIDKEGIITRDSEVTRNNIQFMLNAVFSGLCTTCRVSPGKDNKANTITTNPQGNKVEGGIVSEKD